MDLQDKCQGGKGSKVTEVGRYPDLVSCLVSLGSQENLVLGEPQIVQGFLKEVREH